MTLCWCPPDADGGAPITGYIFDYQAVSSSHWSKVNVDVALGTTLEVNGLNMGTKYHFRVAAKNKVGFGPYSETSIAYATLGKK